MSRYRLHHTCDLCMGVNPDKCPNNERETEEVPCSRCNGEGQIYYDSYTGEEVPKDVWGLLPEEYREEEICDECGGTGYITVYKDEYEE